MKSTQTDRSRIVGLMASLVAAGFGRANAANQEIASASSSRVSEGEAEIARANSGYRVKAIQAEKAIGPTPTYAGYTGASGLRAAVTSNGCEYRFSPGEAAAEIHSASLELVLPGSGTKWEFTSGVYHVKELTFSGGGGGESVKLDVGTP